MLTATHRDDWARAREHLLSLSDRNKATLQTIEHSLFALALDSSVLPLQINHASETDACTAESLDAHIRNVSGVGRVGQNRWFDTCRTVIVEPNGRAGCLGEHSPADGETSAAIMTFASAVPAPKPSEPLPDGLPGTAVAASRSSPGEGATPAAFTKLEWDIDAATHANIDAAFRHVRQLCAASDTGTLCFADYGTNWIRAVAQQPVDAFLQQVLQLAMATLAGHQTPTYEAASTRRFRHGRTEGIRSFTRQSYEFVRAVREVRPPREVYAKLCAATAEHAQLTRAAANGHGIERHLAALRWVYDADEDGPVPAAASHSSLASSSSTGTTMATAASLPSPPQNPPYPPSFSAGTTELLFTDPLFAASQTWHFSTSCMPCAGNLAGGGFGAVVPDTGVGVCYHPEANRLKFSIETKHLAAAAPRETMSRNLGENPTARIRHAIIEALRYLRLVCEGEAVRREGN